ncbi:hypothetical protein AAFM46_11040 [Arthrobacter sp. TMP15]|uniref:hypothetical protein n=1 Tax=Arthrobacter sp. TMP15 TaxID=3140789 RepID=UPI0031BB40F7
MTEAVNAPADITGELPLGDVSGGQITQWGSLLVAEQEGKDPVCAIVDHLSKEGDMLKIGAGGFSMYPTGLPWLGKDFAGVKVDPLDMVRKVWAEVQSYPDGDLGVVVDPLKSPVRIGTPEVENNFTTGAGEDVSFVSGPFRLAWWSTDDLGKVFSDLASSTPFEYAERSAWVGEDSEELTHRIQLGYPTIGTRKSDLHFEIGVNVTAAPSVSQSAYASEVMMLGAGDGSARVKADRLTQATGRLRRVHVAEDKSLKSRSAATAAARPLLASFSPAHLIESIEVIDHDSAPYGSFAPGDVIFVQGDAGWADLALWVRIHELTVNCDTGSMSLKVGVE